MESSIFPEGVEITVSGGVSQYEQGPLSEFISAVDKLLYTAKEEGRNRIKSRQV